jgi:hypothetical protein
MTDADATSRLLAEPDQLERDESLYHAIAGGAGRSICRDDRERALYDRIAPGIARIIARGGIAVTSNDPPLYGPDPYGDE